MECWPTIRRKLCLSARTDRLSDQKAGLCTSGMHQRQSWRWWWSVCPYRIVDGSCHLPNEDNCLRKPVMCPGVGQSYVPVQHTVVSEPSHGSGDEWNVCWLWRLADATTCDRDMGVPKWLSSKKGSGRHFKVI